VVASRQVDIHLQEVDSSGSDDDSTMESVQVKQTAAEVTTEKEDQPRSDMKRKSRDQETTEVKRKKVRQPEAKIEDRHKGV
jgi:hypothetical protein